MENKVKVRNTKNEKYKNFLIDVLNNNKELTFEQYIDVLISLQNKNKRIIENASDINDIKYMSNYDSNYTSNVYNLKFLFKTIFNNENFKLLIDILNKGLFKTENSDVDNEYETMLFLRGFAKVNYLYLNTQLFNFKKDDVCNYLKLFDNLNFNYQNENNYYGIHSLTKNMLSKDELKEKKMKSIAELFTYTFNKTRSYNIRQDWIFDETVLFKDYFYLFKEKLKVIEKNTDDIYSYYKFFFEILKKNPKDMFNAYYKFYNKDDAIDYFNKTMNYYYDFFNVMDEYQGLKNLSNNHDSRFNESIYELNNTILRNAFLFVKDNIGYDEKVVNDKLFDFYMNYLSKFECQHEYLTTYLWIGLDNNLINDKLLNYLFSNFEKIEIKNSKEIEVENNNFYLHFNLKLKNEDVLYKFDFKKFTFDYNINKFVIDKIEEVIKYKNNNSYLSEFISKFIVLDVIHNGSYNINKDYIDNHINNNINSFVDFLKDDNYGLKTNARFFTDYHQSDKSMSFKDFYKNTFSVFYLNNMNEYEKNNFKFSDYLSLVLVNNEVSKFNKKILKSNKLVKKIGEFITSDENDLKIYHGHKEVKKMYMELYKDYDNSNKNLNYLIYLNNMIFNFNKYLLTDNNFEILKMKNDFKNSLNKTDTSNIVYKLYNNINSYNIKNFNVDYNSLEDYKSTFNIFLLVNLDKLDKQVALNLINDINGDIYKFKDIVTSTLNNIILTSNKKSLFCEEMIKNLSKIDNFISGMDVNIEKIKAQKRIKL